MGENFKHIELFAGCGGMSLGLEAAGFDLFMANELSPMAGETFAYNILGEDLTNLANEKKKSKKVLWLKSKYSNDNLKNRLRENPFDFSNCKNSDIDSKTDLNGKLIIGNINHLLNYFSQNKTMCYQLREKDIDILSGGPPCQGFSLAGKRIKDDYKNLLPLSFARFAGLIQPKVVLLENVKGITSPFKTEEGVKTYAWLEVAKAFVLKGYFPVCMLLNSKYFGVPQNRPRFILFAFRKDIFEKLRAREDNSELTNEILTKSYLFYNKVYKNRKNLSEIKQSDIKLYDIESDTHFFNGFILPEIKTVSSSFVKAEDAIGDITVTRKMYNLKNINSEYAIKLQKLFQPSFQLNSDKLQNHQHREHSYKVKARFRLYQILNNLNGMRQDSKLVISGKFVDEIVFKKVFKAFENEALLVATGEQDIFEKPKDIVYFKDYLNKLESKKHSQRAIKNNEPAPAQMTIPDDLCHYSIQELRTLTVREMARFQSFPDSFVFRSKVTTGGQQRKFEVPQYTQVGNAVPPILAYELGKTIHQLLKSIE